MALANDGTTTWRPLRRKYAAAVCHVSGPVSGLWINIRVVAMAFYRWKTLVRRLVDKIGARFDAKFNPLTPAETLRTRTGGSWNRLGLPSPGSTGYI